MVDRGIRENQVKRTIGKRQIPHIAHECLDTRVPGSCGFHHRSGDIDSMHFVRNRAQCLQASISDGLVKKIRLESPPEHPAATPFGNEIFM
jgi:hypothetical protein